ncbi:hypothetical protein [Grimontia hollisae]|uniref:hypothetical protein n=1 Tax=Grimontia hollisae TaxID=673 RepID=UPI001303869D|nr:hypothetical protein [Grimontia hollisae]
MKGLITIVCYNRISELKRLLSCLSQTEIKGLKIDLVISIDKSDKQGRIHSLCENYKWLWGDKTIICRETNLGLKSHVIQCMSLVDGYDFNVVLEDDLLISPYFLDYIKECLSIENSVDIGMYSLYSYNKKESDKTPFYPLVDSFDAFYVQFPSSWGFFITKEQWDNFEIFLKDYDCDFFEDDSVPSYVSSWSASSWKKHFCRYLVMNNKQVLFPRYSLTSNSGADGSHESDIGSLYSVPLVLGKRNWRIPSLKESFSIYDVNFELMLSIYSNFDSIYHDGFSLGSTFVSSKSRFITENSYIKLYEAFGIVMFTTKRYLNKLNHKILGRK